MRKSAPLLSLILILTLYAGATAQTSPNSTQAKASPAASKELTPDQAIAVLIAEVRELRETRDALVIERDAAKAALEEERKVSDSFERSYASAEKEIATLNRAIDKFERAIAVYDKVVDELTKQRDGARADAKRANKRAALVTIILIAREAARILF